MNELHSRVVQRIRARRSDLREELRSQQCPEAECGCRCADDAIGEAAGHCIRQALHGGSARLRHIHQPHDVCEDRGIAGGGCSNHEGAVAVDGSRCDRITCMFKPAELCLLDAELRYKGETCLTTTSARAIKTQPKRVMLQ